MATSSLTFLLVEDDSIGDILAKIIMDKGHNLHFYKEGKPVEEALRNSLRHHRKSWYDVGIFDISLPDMSGDQLIALSKEVYEYIPVICISGLEREFRAYYQVPKADIHIPKPLDLEKIKSILNYRDSITPSKKKVIADC